MLKTTTINNNKFHFKLMHYVTDAKIVDQQKKTLKTLWKVLYESDTIYNSTELSDAKQGYMHTAKLLKKYVLYNATWDMQNALQIFNNSATQKLAKKFLKNTRFTHFLTKL